MDFYLEACQQIIQRFPLKNNIIKDFNISEARNVKEGKTASVIPVCRLFRDLIGDIDFQNCDTEWRTLRNTEIIKEFPDDTL